VSRNGRSDQVGPERTDRFLDTPRIAGRVEGEVYGLDLCADLARHITHAGAEDTGRNRQHALSWAQAGLEGATQRQHALAGHDRQLVAGSEDLL